MSTLITAATNISTIDSVTLAALTPLELKSLTRTQLGALSSVQLSAFSATLVSMLPLKYISAGALVGIQPAAINGLDIKSLSTYQIAGLLTTQLPALTTKQISTFQPAQVKALTNTEIGTLSSIQLGVIKATSLKELTTDAILYLTTNAVAGLTSVQLSKLTTVNAGQLESFTPAQVARLSFNAITWLHNQNFATISGAVTTGSGIETSKIITISVPLLSIAGGNGADSITGSTGADSITGGVGADTITGGLGSDTIIGGAGSNIYQYSAGDSTSTAVDVLIGTFASYNADLVKLNSIVGTLSVLPAQSISALSESVLNTELNSTNGTLSIHFKGGSNTSIAQLTYNSGKYWAIDLNGDGTFTAAADLLIDVTNSTLTNVTVETFGVRLPTLSVISNVTSATEDTEKTISFSDLVGLANEADAMDIYGHSGINAFVVKSVNLGTLKIGINSASASVWNTITNATIDSTHFAYWTPAANANGALTAFSVVAKDNEGYESALPAIPVNVMVAAANDAPTGSVTISGTPTKNETLTPNTSTIADVDGLGAFSYQWKKTDGSVIATTFTLLMTQAEVGQQISVVVSYIDSGGTHESLNSSAVTVTLTPTPPTGATLYNGHYYLNVPNSCTWSQAQTEAANPNNASSYTSYLAVVNDLAEQNFLVSLMDQWGIEWVGGATDNSIGGSGYGGTLSIRAGQVLGGYFIEFELPAMNNAPTATNLSAAETYTEDTPLNLTDMVISDVDSAIVTATLTLSNPVAGSLNIGASNGVTSTFSSGVWSVTGAMADVNILLAVLTFTPTVNFNSNFTISTSVSDGSATPLTGSKPFTGTAVNDAPILSVGVAIPNYTQNGSPVILSSEITLTDADLTTTNYNGSTMILARSGGANVEDVFSSVNFSGGNVVVSGTTIGTFTNSNGTLVIAFNSSATQALVNQALALISYSNTSENPPASVQIAWTFNDGNTGAQGSGGALSALGTTGVSVSKTIAPTFPEGAGSALAYKTDYNGMSALSALTVEMWIKTSDTMGGLLSWAASGIGNDFLLYLTSPLTFDIWVGNQKYEITTTKNVSNSNWHHLAATWTTAGIVTLYVDGTAYTATLASGYTAYTTALTNTSAISYDRLLLGNDQDMVSGVIGALNLTQTFSGSMDSVAVWNIAKIFTPATYKTTISGSETNLVNYWSMDESTGNFVDSKSAMNLTVGSVSKTIAQTFPENTSTALAYKTDYNGMSGLSALTVEMWVKTTDTNGNLLSWAASGIGNDFLLPITNSSTISIWVGSERYVADLGTATVSDNAWHHLAATWTTAGIVTLYVDGTAYTATLASGYTAYTTTLTNTSAISYDRLLLGNDQDMVGGVISALDPTQTFSGSIDSVAVWNIAKTFTPATYKTAISGSETGLVNYWSMDESTGNLVDSKSAMNLTTVRTAGALTTEITSFKDFSTIPNDFSKSGSAFTVGVSNGLGGSASVVIPSSSDEIWTLNQAAPITANNGTYTVSGYFHNVSNSGFGALGFSTNSSNFLSTGSSGAPGANSFLGVTFHGGGIYFLNNGEVTSLTNTGGDIQLNNWYKFVFSISETSATTFNLKLDTYNSDVNGTLSVLFGSLSTSVTNANISTFSNLYPFFSAEGGRFNALDNFEITLTGV